ncbi:unnamed protein product [Brassica oleracea]
MLFFFDFEDITSSDRASSVGKLMKGKVFQLLFWRVWV